MFLYKVVGIVRITREVRILVPLEISTRAPWGSCVMAVTGAERRREPGGRSPASFLEMDCMPRGFVSYVHKRVRLKKFKGLNLPSLTRLYCAPCSESDIILENPPALRE